MRKDKPKVNAPLRGTSPIDDMVRQAKKMVDAPVASGKSPSSKQYADRIAMMSFVQAFAQVVAGKVIKRASWAGGQSATVYRGAEYLMVRWIGHQEQPLLVTAADMDATDWVVVEA